MKWKLLGLYVALAAFTVWCLLAAYAVVKGPMSVLDPIGPLLWFTIFGALVGQMVMFLWGRLLCTSSHT